MLCNVLPCVAKHCYALPWHQSCCLGLVPCALHSLRLAAPAAWQGTQIINVHEHNCRTLNHKTQVLGTKVCLYHLSSSKSFLHCRVVWMVCCGGMLWLRNSAAATKIGTNVNKVLGVQHYTVPSFIQFRLGCRASRSR